MTNSIARVLALLGAVAMLLCAARATFAQGDKPSSPEGPSTTITLPATGSTNTSGTAFSITNAGTGRAGYFQVTNTKNVNAALEARTYSTATNAIAFSAGVMNNKAGVGSAAIVAANSGSAAGSYAIIANHRGSGTAIYGYAQGGNGRGVYGYSQATTGTGLGVQGASRSYDGFGGYFTNSGVLSGYGGTAVIGLSNGLAPDAVLGPYALQQAAGEFAGINGVIGTAAKSANTNTFGVIGIKNTTNAGAAVYGLESGATDGYGVLGTALYGTRSVGVLGQTNATDGFGGYFKNFASPPAGIGLASISGAGSIVLSAIGWDNPAGYFAGPNGVIGAASGDIFSGFGVGGYTAGSHGSGVQGWAQNSTTDAISDGVSGYSNAPKGAGVYGYSSASSNQAAGVYGESYSGVTWAVYSKGPLGTSSNLQVDHNAYIFGTLQVSSCTGCAGATKQLDLPGDESKFVEQAGVLATERLGVASGNVVLNGAGKAAVSLPSYFAGLYGDFRYQLTSVGQAASVYVADELKDGRFIIAGGKPGLKVSWQITGVRRDKEALSQPLVVGGVKATATAGLLAPPAARPAPELQPKTAASPVEPRPPLPVTK